MDTIDLHVHHLSYAPKTSPDTHPSRLIHMTFWLSRSCHLSRKRHIGEPASTDDVVQVVEDWLGLKVSCREADIAVRAYQDQRITSDLIGAGSMPIAINQCMLSVLDCVSQMHDRVDTQQVIVDRRQWWDRLVAEDKQREMRATKEIEQSN